MHFRRSDMGRQHVVVIGEIEPVVVVGPRSVAFVNADKCRCNLRGSYDRIGDIDRDPSPLTAKQRGVKR
jgi:hypothetical protein